MADPNRNEASALRHLHILYAVIGVLGGIVIGVVFMLVMPAENDAPEQGNASLASQEMLATQPERWFIWEGNGPLIGDAYQSDGECEKERRNLVALAITEADRRMKNLPPMTMQMIRELGNPADRIAEGLNRVQRAYCRRDLG